MTELNNLNRMLLDINRALADVVRVRETLKSVIWSLEARINELHNSSECFEEFKQLLEKEK